MTDRISIVAMGDATEALGLRAMTEAMGYTVQLYRPGAPNDVGPALKAAGKDDIVILSAHGGPRGLWMGDFAKDIDTSKMDGPWLITAKAFANVTFRDDVVLISTACATRQSGLAQAMFAAGGHLVAPNGDPQGHVILPWIAACLLSAPRGLAEAVAAANALVPPADRFSYG